MVCTFTMSLKAILGALAVALSLTAISSPCLHIRRSFVQLSRKTLICYLLLTIMLVLQYTMFLLACSGRVPIQQSFQRLLLLIVKAIPLLLTQLLYRLTTKSFISPQVSDVLGLINSFYKNMFRLRFIGIQHKWLYLMEYIVAN